MYTRADIEFMLSTSDPNEVSDALLFIAFNELDWKWAQDKFLRLLEDENPDIRGLAATCLGHIGRIHRQIDKKLVVSALRKHLDDAEISGQIGDAIDDIEIFCND